MDYTSISELQQALQLIQRCLDRESREPIRVSAAPADDEWMVIGSDPKQERDEKGRLTVTGHYGVSKAWVHKHLDELPVHRPGPDTGKRRPIRFRKSELEAWWGREMSHS